MKLTDILDVLDVIYEYTTFISVSDIINDVNKPIDLVKEILLRLEELSIIKKENDKYINNMTYTEAYDVILKMN